MDLTDHKDMIQVNNTERSLKAHTTHLAAIPVLNRIKNALNSANFMTNIKDQTLGIISKIMKIDLMNLPSKMQ
jgi:SLT domain-containing protein